MKSFFIVVFITAFSCSLGNAQDFSVYQKKQFVMADDTLVYRIFYPDNYDASKKYPLLLFLHGAGERGNDNESQLMHGASLFIKKEIHTKYPAIVVLPQCPATDYWSNVSVDRSEIGKYNFIFQKEGRPTKALEMVINLTKSLLSSGKIDTHQVYVGGLSMGGMGTFEIVRRLPDTFAAAFAICGGANTETASQLNKTNWWIFHGEKDGVVPVHLSKQMHTALLKAGAKSKLTIYPEDGHDSWTHAFAEPDLIDWLFSNRSE